MAYKEGITGFVRIPESETPEKVFALGPMGEAIKDEARLVELAGAGTKEEAFKEVQIKTPEEARKLGVRLAGTEALFADQPTELTADMLREGSLNLPGELAFDSDKVIDSTSWLEAQKSKLDLAEKTAAEALEKRTAAVGERESWYQKLFKKEEEMPLMEAILQEQYDKYGITGDVAKQRTLIDEADIIRQSMINIKAEMNQKLLIEEGKSTSTSYIQGRKALIERQYNSRLAAESARLTAKTTTIQALQGQITQARSLSNEMVNAMVWDYQRDRDMMKEFIDYNSILISELGDDYKNAISEKYELLENAYNDKKAEAEEKRDLMFKAIEQYGVTLPDLTDMTVEEAREAYQEIVAPIVRKRLEPKAPAAPTSYREWGLAGGEAGTGKTYAEWLAKDKVVDIKSSQRIAAGFAARIEQAGKIIDELGEKFTGKIARLPMPEAFKTEDRKLMEQAERNFVNAVLRRESGAAIAPSEFVSAELQYFPQRGDTDAVLQQKAENREVVFEAMRLEAGMAFSELKGVLPPAAQQGVIFNGVNYTVGDIIENDKGQKGRVEADGTITILE